MIERTKLDWSFITNNIRNKYKNLSDVAKEVNSDWQHLNRLARGDVLEPRFTVGVKLLDLHSDHCPEQHKGLKL